MPRGFVDYLNSMILPLSGEQKFNEAAKAAGFGVQTTPDGGRMITKKSPNMDGAPLVPTPVKRAKFSPRPTIQIAAARN